MNFHLNPVTTPNATRTHDFLMTDLPNDKETEIWVAMNVATRFIQSTINAALKKEGLPSLTWYDVLWSIERQGGTVRPFEVELDVIFEQSNISYLTRKLAAEGLLEFTECPEDGRGKLIRITDKGKALRKRMWKVYGPMLHELWQPIAAAETPDEMARAVRSMTRLPK